MVRWLTFILLTALAAAALPGRMSVSCDRMVARMLGCEEPAKAVPSGASSCCSTESGSPSLRPEDGNSTHPEGVDGCPLCAVVCRELCTQTSPWGVLGLGLGTDGLAHTIPSTVLLDEAEWLPREASARPDDRALEGASLTLDRLRRQARLCVWTT